MIFEIINPSDTYTCLADDPKIAMAAVISLGQGAMGLKDETGKSYETVLFLMSKDEIEIHLKQLFGNKGLPGFINEVTNRIAVSECLNSVMSVGIGSRKMFDDVMKMLPDDHAREEYKTKLHDKNRTSLADWGTYAWDLAKSLRKSLMPQPEPEQDNG